MEKEIKVVCCDDGVFREYDDTYDITLHFESKEDRDRALADMISRGALLQNLRKMFPNGGTGTTHTPDVVIACVETEPSIFNLLDMTDNEDGDDE